MCHVLALVPHIGGARVSGEQLPNVGKIAAGKRRIVAAKDDQLVLAGGASRGGRSGALASLRRLAKGGG